MVAARPEDAPRDVRGLALFLVPRLKDNGELNYTIRRIKDKIATRSVPTGEIELRDSEAWLLGSQEQGVYLILEVLNISRVANSVASVALAQSAMAFVEAAVVVYVRQIYCPDDPLLIFPPNILSPHHLVIEWVWEAAGFTYLLASVFILGARQ